MKKQLIALAAALFAGAAVFAADPGGQFGFVKATFTGSECDTTSDVFANAQSWVFGPEEMYADNLPEKTTVAYGAYMYMEAGVQYDFKGSYDDYVTVKIGSTWVLSPGIQCQERTGSFTPSATDWYKIDLRVANNGGVGGCQTSSQYGILWKKSTETTWHKFVPDTLFKTGEISVNLKRPSKPIVELVSTQMRETDPTVMDVKYRVWSPTGDTVNVRALAFQDGVRSFANVVRPSTFLEGSQIGDGVPANTVNSFAWQVSADWDVDLAKVAVEVLAQDVDAGLVPLDLVTIPAATDSADAETAGLTVSTNQLSDSEALDALMWLYADGDESLTLTKGVLSDENGTLANGASVSDFRLNIGRHIYGAMGYQMLNDVDKLINGVRNARRKEMTSPYGYACKSVARSVEKGNGIYMVVDLDSSDVCAPVSYLPVAPVGGWSADYKTRKLVLRRIDQGESSYYIGVFPITEAQWAYVTGSGGSKTSMRPEAAVYGSIRGSSKGAKYPDLNDVDLLSFFGQLRMITGIATFDLPSDAEWEYAGRAGSTTKYYTGDTEDDLAKAGWYSENSEGRSHDVGEKVPNAWGPYDIHGNVLEWCLDWCPGYEGSLRVLRGGCFYSDASRCTLSYRSSIHEPNLTFRCFGFRAVCR